MEVILTAIVTNMTATVQDIKYHRKVNIEFADAVYAEMVSKRYGIEVCCGKEHEYTILRKEILDLNEMKHSEIII